MLRQNMKGRHKPKTNIARRLRRSQTPAEKLLWNRVRNRKFFGFKIRRQVPIGPFIADFLCVERRLIIEIDGDSHYQYGAQKRDMEREAYLRAQGFAIVRFGEKQTIESVDFVLQVLAEKLQ